MLDSAKKDELIESVSRDDVILSNDESLKSSLDNSVNIAGLSLDELIVLFEKSLKTSSIQEIKSIIEDIKIEFYKKLKHEYEHKKQVFIQSGGDEHDFTYTEPLESTFKELYARYKEKRDQLRKQTEAEHVRNLDVRKELVSELEMLINTEESLQHTFKTFRSIQERWKLAGPVQASERKAMWESYHLQLARFYDYIKINKELRDLDLRKNFEAKTELCEKAEALILESHVVNAFAKLQKLHEQWREIGPVQHELKDDIWHRFKSATSIINKKHQDYFQSLKEQEKINLTLKTELCEQLENIVQREITTIKTWKKASKEVIDIQKKWKEIGYAPQKQNTLIFERFSSLCDVFFTKKRDFFQLIYEQEKHNKQLKTELCEQAELMSTRTDWKEATVDFIALQKQWKEVGSVPLRDSNKLWNKFRKACDTFFTAKSAYFDAQKGISIENVEKKLLAKRKTIEGELITLENNIGFFAHSKNAEKVLASMNAKIQKSKNEIERINNQLKIIQNLDTKNL